MCLGSRDAACSNRPTAGWGVGLHCVLPGSGGGGDPILSVLAGSTSLREMRNVCGCANVRRSPCPIGGSTQCDGEQAGGVSVLRHSRRCSLLSHLTSRWERRVGAEHGTKLTCRVSSDHVDVQQRSVRRQPPLLFLLSQEGIFIWSKKRGTWTRARRKFRSAGKVRRAELSESSAPKLSIVRGPTASASAGGSFIRDSDSRIDSVPESI